MAANCPYCGEYCEAEYVDNGLGMEQVSAHYCEGCGAMEWNGFTRPKGVKLTKIERKTSWLLSGPQSDENPLRAYIHRLETKVMSDEAKRHV